jgi:hypothetical protein
MVAIARSSSAIPVLLAGVVDRHHVRMRQPRHRPRLVDQPALVGGAEQVIVQHLEGDLAVEHPVVGRVDRAHPTLPQRLEEHVAIRRRRRRRTGLTHRRGHVIGGHPPILG